MASSYEITPAPVATPQGPEDAGARPTKLFIGGISRRTTTKQLREHFSKFGRVLDCVAMRQPDGRPRGFGYVTLDTPEAAERFLTEPQTIDERVVDVKLAVPDNAEKEVAKGEVAKVTTPQPAAKARPAAQTVVKAKRVSVDSSPPSWSATFAGTQPAICATQPVDRFDQYYCNSALMSAAGPLGYTDATPTQLQGNSFSYAAYGAQYGTIPSQYVDSGWSFAEMQALESATSMTVHAAATAAQVAAQVAHACVAMTIAESQAEQAQEPPRAAPAPVTENAQPATQDAAKKLLLKLPTPARRRLNSSGDPASPARVASCQPAAQPAEPVVAPTTTRPRRQSGTAGSDSVPISPGSAKADDHVESSTAPDASVRLTKSLVSSTGPPSSAVSGTSTPKGHVSGDSAVGSACESQDDMELHTGEPAKVILSQSTSDWAKTAIAPPPGLLLPPTLLGTSPLASSSVRNSKQEEGCLPARGTPSDTMLLATEPPTFGGIGFSPAASVPKAAVTGEKAAFNVPGASPAKGNLVLATSPPVKGASGFAIPVASIVPGAPKQMCTIGTQTEDIDNDSACPQCGFCRREPAFVGNP